MSKFQFFKYYLIFLPLKNPISHRHPLCNYLYRTLNRVDPGFRIGIREWIKG